MLEDYEAAAREVDEAVIKAEQFTSLIEKYQMGLVYLKTYYNKPTNNSVRLSK